MVVLLKQLLIAPHTTTSRPQQFECKIKDDACNRPYVEVRGSLRSPGLRQRLTIISSWLLSVDCKTVSLQLLALSSCCSLFNSECKASQPAHQNWLSVQAVSVRTVVLLDLHLHERAY